MDTLTGKSSAQQFLAAIDEEGALGKLEAAWNALECSKLQHFVALFQTNGNVVMTELKNAGIPGGIASTIATALGDLKDILHKKRKLY